MPKEFEIQYGKNHSTSIIKYTAKKETIFKPLKQRIIFSLYAQW